MPQTKKHEIKVEFLLEKGVELLWANGYNSTSVNDIVKAAGIPKGSFYFYFKSKEDFAVKALDYYYSEHLKPAFEILKDKSVSPKKRLQTLFEFQTAMLKEELNCRMGCMGCNIGNEMAEHSEDIRKVIFENEKIFKDRLIAVTEEAQELGEIESSVRAKELIEFISSAGKGAMISMKSMNSSYPIDNFMYMVKNLLLK